ncbi:MAG: SpoVA/SpoVAEb family sporulation membrane protein [Clostridia bacterium]|nr:SpoVA/SpoVAEb family sporulation membrane protein [Clostridia bacterium]
MDVETADAVVCCFCGCFVLWRSDRILNLWRQRCHFASLPPFSISGATWGCHFRGQPCLEFKSEGFVLGVGVKMFTIAGPVIVYGTVASVVYGVICWITTLF